MKSIMKGAASAWAEGEALPSAFAAALGGLKFDGVAVESFESFSAWAGRAEQSACALLIEPWIPAWDPQYLGEIPTNRGAVAWALDALAELDAADEAAILAAGLASEAATLHQLRVSRASFGRGTALLFETASGGALVMSLAEGTACGDDPRAVAWGAG